MSGYKTEDQLWSMAKQIMQIMTKEIEANAKWKEETKKRFDIQKKDSQTQTRALIVYQL